MKSSLLQHHKFDLDFNDDCFVFLFFWVGVEFAERFAYQGLASNLIQYLTNVLNEPITEAAKDVNTWVGASSLFPLLGGFIADSYLGRFNTILLSSLIYLVVSKKTFFFTPFNLFTVATSSIALGKTWSCLSSSMLDSCQMGGIYFMCSLLFGCNNFVFLLVHWVTYMVPHRSQTIINITLSFYYGFSRSAESRNCDILSRQMQIVKCYEIHYIFLLLLLKKIYK